jgi:anti-sigma28 factor (negative regulator of flagellin synthesis)
MVELRGPGGAGEQGGRFRGDRWRQIPPSSGRQRVSGKAVEQAFEVERLVKAAQALPAIRRDLVERVRAEIEAGTYETPEKLERTADRLLAELGEEPKDD